MLSVKLILNSVVSTPGAKFFTADIRNFYLMTPLKRKEYVRLKLSDMPEDIVEYSNLKTKVTKDSYIFIAIKRGMCGLTQYVLLEQKLLEERVGKHGYYQSEYTPVLWIHKTRSIAFSLCVENFGVKYTREEYKKHLLDSLNQHYKVTVDGEGTQYLGITLEWYYKYRRVHIYMSGYVPKALKRFYHEPPQKLQDQPYPHAPPNYGAKVKYANSVDNSPPPPFQRGIKHFSCK